MYLTFAEQLRVLLKQRGKTLQDAADAIKMSRQNFTQRMNRNNFSENDMQKIADVLGLDYFVSLGGLNTNIAPLTAKQRPPSKKKGSDK